MHKLDRKIKPQAIWNYIAEIAQCWISNIQCIYKYVYFLVLGN